MKKKLLSCALLGAMSLAQSAMAQDYDDRWYVSGTAGILGTDNDRGTGNAPTFGIGFGKFIRDNISLDVELDRGIAKQGGLDWDLTGAAIVGRYHFVKEGRNWWPYLAAGVGSQYHNEEFVGAYAVGNGDTRKGTDYMAKLGAGLQADLGRVDIRTEAGLRWDNDDNQIGFDENLIPLDRADGFTDLYANVAVLVAIGPEPSAPVTPSAPPLADKTCADLDDDGDGVNNCNDKCPGSQAGQAIGPDGCPVPLTIDLKGVNFDFDRDSLRPDALVILDEAIAILQKYPQMRFEVAGHTDAIGSDDYNQELSERRARVVFDYLGSHGIDTSRMAGPNGFGESRPIAPNANEDGSDNPEGRAKNRRTELNVQN